ncbi:MAG: hypothetical protein JW973_07055 [Bacteroidales bacterium]|nr:hypothetical protein [Bacteroidales bacterium]
MTKFPISRFLFLSLMFSFVSLAISASSFDNTILKLNPDFKFKRFSNGAVELSAFRDGKTVKHVFTDLYADLLLAAYRKQRVGFILNSLAKKYACSEEECRREIKHALNILDEWQIILRDDQLASIP